MSKVRDSKKPHRMGKTLHVDGILTLFDAFFQKTYAGDYPSDDSQDYNSKASFGFTFWAFPGSVALTKGIIFIFFSSAYLYA